MIALALILILLLSIVLIPLITLRTRPANAETVTEDVYSTGNNYEATLETVTTEYTDQFGNAETYELATYDLTKRDESKVVSKDPPQVTFITHGLGGSAGHWSNNDESKKFCYAPYSVIELLKQKAECNVYVAKFSSPNKFELKQMDNEKNYSWENNSTKITKITDNTRHSIVVFEAYKPKELNNFIYSQFNYMASCVVSWLTELDANHEMPRVNLIGHSRGGITNLQYALDHPDLVDSIFSIATPYVGSTSADVDAYLLNGENGGSNGVIGGSGSNGSDGNDGADGVLGNNANAITPRAAVEQEDYPYFFNESALSAFVVLGE